MARRRVRHDPPVSGPVDGDYAVDKVHGIEPGRVGFLASDEDLPGLLGDGGVIERRREGGPRSAVDIGGVEGEVLKVRGLTLVTMTSAQADRRAGRAQRAADDADAILRNEARRSPGGEYDRREMSSPDSHV